MKDIEQRRADRWNFLFIAGMWFQDLFNYDFRRTEQCIIPYATQEGEISFCAYNTGVGWRNIIEKMHMTATLTKWYDEHGRHEIFAGGKKVGMGDAQHDLLLNQAHVDSAANDTFDKLGIAKNSREEKLRAREAKLKQDAENARMAKLYREHILGEQRSEGWIHSTRRSDLAGPEGRGQGPGRDSGTGDGRLSRPGKGVSAAKSKQQKPSSGVAFVFANQARERTFCLRIASSRMFGKIASNEYAGVCRSEGAWSSHCYCCSP